MIDEHESDDELATRLGRALARFDPVPRSVVTAAKASRTWRTIDAELAVLLHDSVLDRDQWAGVRGGGSRLLTFTSPDVTVELEVLGWGRGLIGQVTGARTARVEICHGNERTPVETDALGHFRSDTVPAGPVSVRATDAESGTVTQTEWVVL
jgi:hypothetical protein